MRVIDADELIWEIKHTLFEWKTVDGITSSTVLRQLISDIENQRTVDSQTTGEWIEKTDYNLDTYYDCSVCGESWTTFEGTPLENGMKYCPHCGAKMLRIVEADDA